MTSIDPATLTSPPMIEGLYVWPNVLREQEQGQILREIIQGGWFNGGKKDQVMFFPSVNEEDRRMGDDPSGTSSGVERVAWVNEDTKGDADKVKDQDQVNVETRVSDQSLAGSSSEREKQEEIDQETFLRRTLGVVERVLGGLEGMDDDLFELLFRRQRSPTFPTAGTISEGLPPALQPRPHPQTENNETLDGDPSKRQTILNLYPPGAGITPHVDLKARYDDGVVGVCLVSGVGMRFERVEEGEDEGSLWGSDDGNEEKRDQSYTVYLPKGTIYALTGPARWDWTHGIEERMSDYVLDDAGGGETDGSVEGREVLRDTRVSITFRWLKSNGADGEEGLVLNDMAGEGDWNVRGD